MSTKRAHLPIEVRTTRRDDFPAIIDLCRRVYPDVRPWTEEQLSSHLAVFPEGQFVAVLPESGRLAGMAASLIVAWNDYDMASSWREFTAAGTFANHDPEGGRTLYGADVFVEPEIQRRGVGHALYAARRDLTRRLGLLRIRAGARLRGYHRVAARMGPEEYVAEVVRGRLHDATLAFQLREGFVVLAVVQSYLRQDAESLGYAAVIEWLNQEVARAEDWAGRDPRFLPPEPSPPAAR